MFPVVERSFSRIPHLRDELDAEEEGTDYEVRPVETAVHFGTGPLSIDLETKGGLDPLGAGAAITTVGVSKGPKQAYVFGPEDALARRAVEADLIIGQNYTLYDAWWLYHKWGAKPRRLWDTRFAGHLLNPDTPNDLVYLSREFADPPMQGYWKAKEDYKEDIDKVCATDVDATYRVYLGQKRALEERGQLHIMENNVMPLCNVVLDMRIKGMRVDGAGMERYARELDTQITALRDGLPLEIETENQAGRITKYLYDTLRLPEVKNKEGNQTSARGAIDELLGRLTRPGEATTERLSDSERARAVDFLQRVRDLREVSKLRSSFVNYALDGDGYIHPVLNPGGTATLRMSCSDPNAQNVPPAARRLFLPDEDGWSLVGADMKQAEVIGLLWFAEEWTLIERIRQGEDIHEMVAALIFNTSQPTREQRDFAKTTTFAILYGEAPKTTASRLHLPESDIVDLRREYFKALPGVESYREAAIRHAMRHGYVESPYGVRRYVRVDSPYGTNANKAANAPIQNIPAMVTRYAMIELAEQLPEPARLWMQVHDEVIVTCPDDLIPEVSRMLQAVLGQPQMALPTPSGTGLPFPLTVHVSKRWDGLK
jgi:DNA polymerase-1